MSAALCKNIGYYLIALFVACVWGTTYLVNSDVMAVVSPIQLMVLRFSLAFVTLWMIRPKWQMDRDTEIKVIFIAFFANLLYFTMTNYSIKYTFVANASILGSTSPLFVALLLLVFMRVVPSKGQAFGYIIAFIGVILIVLNGSLSMGVMPMGDFMALMAGFAWAGYGFLMEKYKPKYDSFVLSRKLMFYGLLMSIPFLIIEGAPWNIDGLSTLPCIAELLYLGILASAICYVLWNYCTAKIGAVKTGLFVYVIPVATLVFGAIFTGETITLMGLAGFILVIVGLFFGSREKHLGG